MRIPSFGATLVLGGVAAGVVALVLVLMATTVLAQQPTPTSTPKTWLVNVGWSVSETGRPPTGPQEILATSNDFQPRPLEINVGDTIEFMNDPFGFHTVALGRGRLDVFTGIGPQGPIPNPDAAFPKGGDSFDGTGVVQSGIMQGPATFKVTFTRAGDFQAICDIHELALPDVGMAMPIRVRPAGQALAQTVDQSKVAAATHYLTDWATRVLPLLAQHAREAVAEEAMPAVGGALVREVAAGFGDGHVEGLRFLPRHLVVRAGDWVKWVNPDPDAPHTVTFLPGGGLPDPTQPPPADFNPFAPTPDNVYTGDNLVNIPVFQTPLLQRVLGLPPIESGMIQFASSGNYNFFCALHLQLGMVGTVTVLPRD